jgi:hypothetical protein
VLYLRAGAVEGSPVRERVAVDSWWRVAPAVGTAQIDERAPAVGAHPREGEETEAGLQDAGGQDEEHDRS